jgi:hypothetical protein
MVQTGVGKAIVQHQEGMPHIFLFFPLVYLGHLLAKLRDVFFIPVTVYETFVYKVILAVVRTDLLSWAYHYNSIKMARLDEPFGENGFS